ncbi:MAG: glycosyltransferase family 2 protein [Steroidobacteraceae bacterium]
MVPYAVIIVNYHTEKYVLGAVRSVADCATSGDFGVVIVNNGSETTAESSALLAIRDNRIHVLEPGDNLGFARANNLGIRHAVQAFQPEFLVIMNPDVEFERRGTIERLIDRVRFASPQVAGAQPLVRNYWSASDPRNDLQIRRIPSVFDLAIAGTILLRFVFARRFRHFLMMDLMPYTNVVPFLVPSGAFFVMRASDFAQMNYFDEGTFLYGEELIIGEKLRRQGKHLLLDPNEQVCHRQGASTGFGKRNFPSVRMNRFQTESEIYFARNYLGASRIKCLMIKLAFGVGFAVRAIAWLALRGVAWYRRAFGLDT